MRRRRVGGFGSVGGGAMTDSERALLLAVADALIRAVDNAPGPDRPAWGERIREHAAAVRAEAVANERERWW